jgi:hypothetical protein
MRAKWNYIMELKFQRLTGRMLDNSFQELLGLLLVTIFSETQLIHEINFIRLLDINLEN